MHDVLKTTKALADGNRLRIVMALQGQELCVCQIIGLLELAPSTVSKHMYILRQAGLVQARKDGRWMYYRLVGREAAKGVREAIAWAQRHLAETSQIHQDNKKLQRILRTDRETLCQKQNKN
jgi:ArsR family transcriptional regulator, arsenate/arsenite/antimonite-responsive transcriptional repressor